MKLHHSPRGGRQLTAMLAMTCVISQAFAETEIPRGTLNVDRAFVQVGTRSQLDWTIQYPKRLVDIDIKTKTKVVMRVRALGVALQHGPNLLPVEGAWSLNEGSWNTFFWGIGTSVVPTRILVETVLNSGDVVKFRARGATNTKGTEWFPYHETGGIDPNVIVLKNGDTPPDNAPAFGQGNIQSFLTPYINSTGRMRTGTQDLVILWEASNASPYGDKFDLQDFVVLVTFEAVPVPNEISP